MPDAATYTGRFNPAPMAPPPTVAPALSGRAAKLRAWADAAAKRRGVEYLPHGDPDTLLLWQMAYNLTPEQALRASTEAATQNVSGRPVSDEDIDRIGFATRGGEHTATEYDPAYDVGSASRQAVAGATGQEFTGPNDPRLLGVITRAAGSVGTTLTPEQALEMSRVGYDFKRVTGLQSNGDTDQYWDWLAGQRTQRKLLEGHQMNPATWDSLGDTGRALYLSQIGRSGRDQTEWQQRLNSSRPQGTARPSQGVDFAQNLAGVY